ncbi:MotA/TolQ/ExbB proton channel family protein [Aquabacterium lacunae]|uniref:Biopolymer transport protein ExbB n=1 Tax=Aquabacterium lacunae TaxID=2528630 RepID=A0A4V2JFP6_9BURK|nr:MotA/TolQ/ExbB proton channel family protein [Aquabacterium lacunae]TBO31308.1 MotA/TolQ/ExbB proton channel family protein [Aquabacterium lacunae]
MDSLQQLWAEGDAVIQAVAVLMLLMSVASWVLIGWKTWLLNRVRRDLPGGVQAFWRSADLAAAEQSLAAHDRDGVLQTLVQAARQTTAPGSLEAQVHPHAQLTRRLRDSLHVVLQRLQYGQVVLASVGAVSPFIGLFGTVWGIYHAIAGISAEGSASLERVAGPVGEALIMTAVGLAVAIPAVLAYNLFGKIINQLETDLEGFAHDLREALLGADRPASQDD